MIQPWIPFLLTSLALAQAPPPRPLRGGQAGQVDPRGFRRPGANAMVSELQRLQAERLRTSLGIPEDRARAIATRQMRFIQESSQHNRQITQMRLQFDEILRGPGLDEEKGARLKPLLEHFLALRQEQQELRRNFEDEVRTGLTPTQQVRLILQIEEFQRNLHEGLREALGRGGARGQGPR
jgi:hypothetical protein